jgi:hypothetical protein
MQVSGLKIGWRIDQINICNAGLTDWSRTDDDTSHLPLFWQLSCSLLTEMNDTM